MRVPLSWLSEYVNITDPAEEVAEKLTDAGLEVKDFDIVGLPGAELEWDRELIVLGRVLKVEQHPDADRLVLATVDFGAEEPRVVVTGAPNLFPFLGQGDLSEQQIYSPYAMEGATLYDGHKDGRKTMKLKGRPLRGIYNDAMLLSEKELGISEEHEGIILMRQDEYAPNYEAGTPLQDVLGDVVLDIDIIPNIARCASMVGVARELAALTGQPLRTPSYKVLMEGPSVEDRVSITTDEPELNPRFVALIIEGVDQRPSPYWMQHRLRLARQRPINVVVDISNYVMLEMGQPNHTFDYDYLRQRADQYDPDGPIHIHTRLPQDGETLTTLDGEIHELEPYTILVTDPAGNLSLGGIMGGYDSEIKPTTTTVLLEAAAWNFINIRRSANALDIHSDAAFRFSRGVHPSQARLGALRAAELLRRLAGGTVSEGVLDAYFSLPETVQVELNPTYVCKLSGLDLSPEEMAELLESLEFKVDPYGDYLLVTVPDHRMDIEGPHDLVEEICRMVGYENIPATLLADTLPQQRGNIELEREERVRDSLVNLGLQEIISYRLTSAERERKLLPDGPPDDRVYVTLTNPPAPDRNVMRHSLLASVLEAAARNSRHQDRLALFEIGAVFLESEEGVLPDEIPQLALLLTSQSTGNSEERNEPDFYDLKGIVEQMLDSLHVPVTFTATSHPSFRPGRIARIEAADNRQVGLIGELHPTVVGNFDLKVESGQPVLAAQIDMSILLPLIPDRFEYEEVSSYPPVLEDLALVVDQSVPAADVTAALSQAGSSLLKDVTLFDVYEGDQIAPNKKSLAYHLTFQAPDKTLNAKTVAKQRQRILKQLEKQIGAKLRE